VTVRALLFSRYGDPAEVLAATDLPLPAPGPGEVRVRLLARPLNPSDLLFVRGDYGRAAEFRPVRTADGVRTASPAGFEGAGIVDALGPGVDGPAAGTRVAVSATGTWQEYVTAPAGSVIAVGDRVPLTSAAQLTVNPLTANLLLDDLALRPGDVLLLTAGRSAVSRMIVHLARARGIRCLALVRAPGPAGEPGTAGEPDAAGAGAGAGADDGGGAAVVAGAGDEPVSERVRAVTGGQGAHAALDSVAGPDGLELLRAVRPGGRVIVYGMLSGRPLPVPPAELVFRGLRVEGFWLPERLARLGPAGQSALTERVLAQIAAGLPGLEVEASYDLGRYREALSHVARRGRRARIMLTG
jgi:NADPH:quinone reductase-like Zn-dependent oxidoreductase